MTKLVQLPGVDVAIVAGGTAAISAAIELKRSGLSVMILGGRSYLGEDICDALRLFLPQNMDMSHPLAQRFYGPAHSEGRALRPMHLKLEIERVLREEQIPYLLTTMPGEVMLDARGAVKGLTLCNRSGRQYLPCRIIVDGSLRGETARLSGAEISKPQEKFEVVRRIIGGRDTNPEIGVWRSEGQMSYTSVIPSGEWKFEEAETEETLWTYSCEGALKDGSWSSWMNLEQETRLHSYRPAQHMAADGIFARTGERLNPEQPAQELDGAYTKLSGEAVSCCAGTVYVTGLLANVSLSEENDIIRHDKALLWGQRIAELVKEKIESNNTESDKIALRQSTSESNVASVHSACTVRLPQPVQAKELCDTLRWQSLAELEGDAQQTFAAIEEVDVLVVGGGTGGAPAGISAVRAGANTLVSEYCSALGGIGTVGLIGSYYYGHRVGFTTEMDREVSAKSPMKVPDGSWDVEAKMQWYHEQTCQGSGRVWYKTMACGALVEGDKVVGAIIATPQGRIAVRAKCVVDSTGSADVAAAAGAQTERIGSKHVASQGTGLGARNPGVRYDNTDYDFIDVNDVQDTTSAFSTAREKFSEAFDLQQIVDSRERRRIIGDIEISPMDILLERVFPDTVSKAYSNFDTHGFTVNPFFMLVPPDHEARLACVPLRALLPKGIDGIVVTGLGISADRDAMPVLRMQACVQNQGYAAGLAAATADHGTLRELDIKALQKKLVAVGNLEPEMLESEDSFPLSKTIIERALLQCATSFEHLDRVFTLPKAELISRVTALYHQAAEQGERLNYAHILGVLGDDSGAESLIKHIENSDWDAGWDYKGMGQFGESMSPLDGTIMALGLSGSASGLEVLIEKAEQLPEDAAFSHYRALSSAFANMADSSGVTALEQLLERPRLSGHAQTQIADRIANLTDVRQETGIRNRALIELHLAKALVQMQPDHERGTQILAQYAKDQRATFARHAKAILDERGQHMKKIQKVSS